MVLLATAVFASGGPAVQPNQNMQPSPEIQITLPGQDNDGDGYFFPANTELSPPYDAEDCNDNDPSIHPNAKEICGNNIDDDCNNSVDGDDITCNICGNSGDDSDTDNDGIPKCFDLCPDESSDVPSNAVFDEHGCSVQLETGDGGWQIASGMSNTINSELDGEKSSVPYTTGFSITGSSISSITGHAAEEYTDDSFFVVVDPTTPQGRQALRISQPSGSGLSQIHDLKPDTTYSLSFYVKIIDGATDKGAASFYFTGDDGNSGAIKLTKHNWERYKITFTTGSDTNNIPYSLYWVSMDESTLWYLDGIQLEEAPESTNYYEFNYEKGCCAGTFCWTGGTCVDDQWYEKYTIMPPIGSGYGDNGFRCIDGNWSYQKAKFDPRYKTKGYCPHKEQCFGAPGQDNYAGAVYDLLDEKLPQLDMQDPQYYKILDDLRPAFGSATSDVWCRENNTFDWFSVYDESFFCLDGNWTTRTKAIALQMMDIVKESGEEDFTLFCDSAENALNRAQGLGFEYWRPWGFKKGAENDIQLFFDGSVDGYQNMPYFNEWCVLRMGDKVIAGTSLNGVNLTEQVDLAGKQYSVLQMIKGPFAEGRDYCDDVAEDMSKLDGRFYPCSPDKVDGKDDSDVWFNPSLQSVIFTMIKKDDNEKHYVKMTSKSAFPFLQAPINALKSIIDTLMEIMGIAREKQLNLDQVDFIKTAGDFDKLYISSFEPGKRKISAIRETRYDEFSKGFKGILTAEYTNYYSDVCRIFFDNPIVKFIMSREQESNWRRADCNLVILGDNPDEWKYDVYVETLPNADAPDADIHFESDEGRKIFGDEFWNDLTAKVRTKPVASPETSSHDAPEIGLVGAPMAMTNQVTRFNFSSPVAGVKAMLWSFGDGRNFSLTEFNGFPVEVEHVYYQTGTFEVKAYFLFDDYVVMASDPILITVVPEPEGEIVVEQPYDIETGKWTNVTFNLVFSDPRYAENYDAGYAYYWDFGDMTDVVAASSDAPGVKMSHKYLKDKFSGIPHGIFNVSVNVLPEDQVYPFVFRKTVVPSYP